MTRRFRRTLDLLSPVAGLARQPFSPSLIAPSRTPYAPPAVRPGIVGERRKFFDTMADETKPVDLAQYISPPPPPPSLRDVAPFLPHPSELPPVQYIVQLSTADAKWAGTDKDVYLQLVGDLYTTPFILLKEDPQADIQTSLRYSAPVDFNPATSPSDFPVGSIREFRFNASPVGNLVKICIRHDSGADSSAAWKLERVIIRNDDLHRTWTFWCARWLNRDMGNEVELKPSREVSAGRRASRRASRRLSSGKLRVSHAAESTPVGGRFQSMRDRFGRSDSAIVSDDAVSNANQAGTRRVSFQLQKFTHKTCHVYLMGDIPILGGWRPEQALRMNMQLAADGTWRGEWRLELEIDDDYDEIQYTYLIINESDAKESRRVESPDRLRRFKLSAPDSLGRITEGGRIHVRDSFGCNKFGLPSASPGSPSLILRKDPPRTGSIQTPRANVTMIPNAPMPLVPIVSTIDPEPTDDDDGLRRNLSSALDLSFNTTIVKSGNFVNSSNIDDEGNGSVGARSAKSEDSPSDGAVDKSDAVSESGIHDDGDIVENESVLNDDVVETEIAAVGELSPKGDIERDGEEARREWEVQLDASDGQLLKSAQRLIRQQSEVSYLKKRNSHDLSNSPLLLSSAPASPGKTSPVSSEGTGEDISYTNGRSKRAIIELSHSEIKKPLIEERNRLLSEIERLKEEADRRGEMYHSIVSTHASLEGELGMMKEIIAQQCENHDAQQAELVRLVMDGQEAYRASRDELVSERDVYHQRWAKEFKTRRKLFNTIQELRGNIRVFCRVRPRKEAFLSDGTAAPCAVDFPDASVGENARIRLGAKGFEFDHVFPPSSSQSAVYDETAGVVASVLDGYNVCVFAYGQTGSGKTHTMNGPDNDRGVNYRALVDLFDIAAQRAEFTDIRVCVSMLEIYNENLRDLIRDDDGRAPPKLEIRKDAKSSSANAVYVPNLTEVEVNSVESVWSVMEKGSANRKKGKTNMNEHSSRSHLILRVAVSCEDFASGMKSSGVLHLVDLAGSERVGRSNVSGERLKEAQHINKSLATLGDVFMSLLSHSSHVPYRNSKLTYLLQDCLGGDSKTLMFVNVSADVSDAAETISSLQFAQRVAKIELGIAQKHTERTAETKAIASLQVKEKELGDLNSKVSTLQRELRRKDESVSEANERARDLETELRATKTRLDEQRRRDSVDREGSAHELRGLHAQLEKGQSDMRAAKQKTKEVISAKDDEISKLKALLRAKEQKIVELSQQPPRPIEKPPTTPATRLNRPASTPNVSRRAERTALGKVPRNAATFTARSRHVRFESPKADSGEVGVKQADSALMPPPPTPGGARRTVKGPLPRSQTIAGPRAQRQNSRLGVSGPAKGVTYAFGTRIVESTGSAGATAQKPSRNTRLPRAQTTLRPAQRVSQSNGRIGQPSLTGAGRAGSGLRRAGTVGGPMRTVSDVTGQAR